MLTYRRHVLYTNPPVTKLKRFMGMVNQLGKFVLGSTHFYGNAFAKIVLGTGMMLGKQHSSEPKRSLHLLKYLHIATPTVKQALLQMSH